MDIINLVSYIREGRFLGDTVLPFDCIVREKLPAELSDTKHKHLTFLDVGYDFGLAGQMSALSMEYKNILVVVESVNMLYILPWLQQLPEKFHVTVLNLGAGVASYLTKSLPELDDVALLLTHIAVKEVRDGESLRQALKAGGKQYIRIPASEVPEEFFAKWFDYEGGIGDLRAHSFEGIGGTVLAPGGVLVHAIHAVQQLQDEGVFHDLFLLGEYDFTLTPALQESISKTEKLIVLLDQKFNTSFIHTIKSKLREAGLNPKLHIITPDTRKVNTVLAEYLWEQARRDGAGIATQIKNLHS